MTRRAKPTGQTYTPRPRWFRPSTDGGPPRWDAAARAWPEVEPGEVEALLRVERSA